MTILECPICGECFRCKMPGPWSREPEPSKVCPNGHRVSKLRKRVRRLARVRRQAEREGLTEATYRRRQRLRAEGQRAEAALAESRFALNRDAPTGTLFLPPELFMRLTKKSS